MYRNIFFFISLLLIVSACQTKQPKLTEVAFQGAAQGTYYMVKYYDVEARDLQSEVDSILKAFDQSLSLWVPNSVISKVNRKEEVILDEHFVRNLEISNEIAQKTNGAFDYTLGPLIEAWGFGFKEKIPLTQDKVDSMKAFVGYSKVDIVQNKIQFDDPRMEVNFNAVAQGYSVDLIGAYLSSKGIDSYLVDIGGEILTSGYKPGGVEWVVGIQKPTDDAEGAIEAQVRVNLTNKAFVTSGSYRKYYEVDGKRYSHIIDAQTGYPVTHQLLSVTVLAKSCAEADAYATAFMVMGMEKAKKMLKDRQDLEAFFIYDENGEFKYEYTEGLGSLIKD